MLNIFKNKNYLILVLITFLSSLFIWLTFYYNIPGKIDFPDVSLETVYANYDGPNYMAISKCGYDKTCIGSNFSLPQPLEYYPAHLPGFPLIINFFDMFTTTTKAMLLATLSGSLLLSLISFEFFKLFTTKKSALWLAVLFIFFPARLFVLRTVGAPETWFIAATLASIVLFTRKKYLSSALLAVLAQTLKTPGIILFVSYILYALYQYSRHPKRLAPIIKRYSPYFLVPFAILPIFYLYKLQTGNFWAYFHSGDNFHLNSLPYLVFISTKSWIHTLWLEDIIYLFLFALWGIYLLYKRYKISPVIIYPIIFTVVSLFIAHRDISRYIAPVYPFLFVAFKKPLCSKTAKTIFPLILPAIILFVINFIAKNTAPIADWTPYL